MRIEQDIKLGFKDVLIRPKRSTLSSRSAVSLERTFTFKHTGSLWTGIPIIAANMDHTGTFEMAQALHKHQLLTAVAKHYDEKSWEKFTADSANVLPFVFATAGANETDFAKLQSLVKQLPINFLCLDVANGYTQLFVDFVRKVRQTFPDKIIMAGNVVTGEMTEELIISGADIVKIGIGPGSVCTTRTKTGVGYPQLSAIIECADAAHGLKGLVCADGGCTSPGDIAKAFGGGADFVMLGGMLAGHKECAGQTFESNGQQVKRFYGMSSSEAMTKHQGTIAPYRASEGKSVLVPYRGNVENTVLDILGGLRSACTYVGAQRLKELSKCTTFVRVNEQANPSFTDYETSPD